MEKRIEQFKLDPTLNWNFAEIVEVDELKIVFNLIDEKNIKKQGIVKKKKFQLDYS